MNGIIKIASFVLFLLTILFLYQLIEIWKEIVVETNDNNNPNDVLSSHHNKVFHVYDLNRITSLEQQTNCQEKFLDMPIVNRMEQPPPNHGNNNNACRNLVSDEIKIAFQKDGVVAIRGLLSSTLLTQLQKAGTYLTDDNPNKQKYQRSGRQFHTTKMGAIFLSNNHNNHNDDDLLSIFRTVAIKSILPQISSELMGMLVNQPSKQSSFTNQKDNDDEHYNNQTLRVLR